MTIHDLLEQLEDAGLHYRLASHREFAVMAIVTVPYERWEIEVFEDGHVEIEVFKCAGEIADESALKSMIEAQKD